MCSVGSGTRGDEVFDVDIVSPSREEVDASRERFTMLRCVVERLHALEDGTLQ